MAGRLQLRGDTLANWLKYDPVLMEREVAIIASNPDKPKVYDLKKVGDGKSKFSELPMLGYECLQDTGDSQQFPMSQKAATDALVEKFDKANVVQELGEAEDKVVSQKVVKEHFIKKVYLKDLPNISHIRESANEFSFSFDNRNAKCVFLKIQDLQGKTFTLYNIPIDIDKGFYKITFYDESLKFVKYDKSTQRNYSVTVPSNAYYASINFGGNSFILIENALERTHVPGLFNGISYDSSFFGLSFKNHIDFIKNCEGLTNVQNVLYQNSEDNKKQVLSYIEGSYDVLKSWKQSDDNSQNIHQLTKVVNGDNPISFELDRPIFGAVKIHRPNGWVDGYTCVDEYGNSTVKQGRFNATTFTAAFCKKLIPNNAAEVDSYLYYKDEEVDEIDLQVSRANIFSTLLLSKTLPFSIVDNNIESSTYEPLNPSSSYRAFSAVNIPVESECEYYFGIKDSGFLSYGGSASNSFLLVFQADERKPISYIKNAPSNNVNFKNGFRGWYCKTPSSCKYVSLTLYNGNIAYKIEDIKAFVCKKKNLDIAINEVLNATNAQHLAAEDLTRNTKDVSKKIWVLGDSISATGYGETFTSKRGYGSFGGWVKYFCEQIMPEYIANNAHGGYTITENSTVVFEGDTIKSGTSNSYIAEIEELVKLYTEEKAEAPDYLMLVGCTNDFGKTRFNPDGWSQRSVVLKSDLDNSTLNPNGLDYDSFMESKFFSVDNIQIPISNVPMFKIAGAIRYIIQRVGTLFPNCKFIIVTSLQAPDNWVSQKQCHDEMKWVANRLSIPVIDISGQANTPMLWDMRKEGANTAATIPRRFINDGFHPYGAKDSAGNSFITAGAMYQGLFIAEQFKALMLHDTVMSKNVVDYTQGENGNGYPSGN